ncbi:MAG: hypothetical protein ACX93U_13235 [Salipiger thiooxidans]|uniref:hypothetical protein n=1 Tax=Salipiger thiooxidans TaxID=282683 RepID=UPI001CFB4A18|nr:hypothetical protein [Salipiger thiooxidans]
MPDYKFLNNQDIPYILEDETIIVRRASYYVKKYEATKNEWIGDPEEHRIHTIAKNIDVSELSEEARAYLIRIGFTAVDGGVGTIGEIEVIGQLPDHYIYCISSGPLEKLRKTMCEASAHNQEPYDACRELKSRSDFFETFKQGRVYNYDTGEEITKRIAVEPFREVLYTSKPLSLDEAHGNPSVKRDIFSDQMEHRFLANSVEYGEDIVSLKFHLPGLSNVFSRVF